MVDVIVYIASYHVDFVDAVDSRSGVTMDNFGLYISKKCLIDMQKVNCTYIVKE